MRFWVKASEPWIPEDGHDGRMGSRGSPAFAGDDVGGVGDDGAAGVI